MRQRFKQYIYCNDNSLQNHPQGLKKADLISGNAFGEINWSQIGVQAPPGTKFYINSANNPVIVGFTGLFELDLSNGGFIGALSFDSDSLDYISRNDSAILILDVAYWEGGE